jgi:hypothetical protein
MIYLTAQRVRSASLRTSGVNAFLHRPAGPVPAGPDSLRIVDQVSQDPGEVVGMSVIVPPGGNAVEAFLDLVVDDALDQGTLTSILSAIGDAVHRATSNEVWGNAAPGALFRLYALPSLDLPATYRELAEGAIAVFTSPATTPIRIIVERDTDAATYFVDDASAERLRCIHGPNWAVPRLRVAHDVGDDFRFFHGDLTGHLIEVATGLALHYVRGLGGVVFIDRTGQELGLWPNDATARA